MNGTPSPQRYWTRRRTAFLVCAFLIVFPISFAAYHVTGRIVGLDSAHGVLFSALVCLGVSMMGTDLLTKIFDWMFPPTGQ